MTKARNLCFLDGTSLKLIALLSMILDHVGDQFFPGQTWMRILGRLAMPIFSFCVAEAYAHTRDRRKYLLRLGLFALISELPFDLMIAGKPDLSHQNIMLTFFLAVLAVLLYDRITEGKRSAGRTALGVGAVLLIALLALLLRTDYSFCAVGLVFLFCVLRGKAPWIRCGGPMLFHLLLRNVGIYLWGFLSFPLLLLYNGQKGRGFKWFFYIFYPGHMLLLFALRLLLAR